MYPYWNIPVSWRVCSVFCIFALWFPCVIPLRFSCCVITREPASPLYSRLVCFICNHFNRYIQFILTKMSSIFSVPSSLQLANSAGFPSGLARQASLWIWSTCTDLIIKMLEIYGKKELMRRLCYTQAPTSNLLVIDVYQYFTCL